MHRQDVCVAPVWCSADRDEAALILQRAGIAVRIVRVARILPLWEVRVDKAHQAQAQQLLNGKMMISYPFLKIEPRVNKLLNIALAVFSALFFLVCLVTLSFLGSPPFEFAIRLLSVCIAFLLLYYALRRLIDRIAHPALQMFAWFGVTALAWLLAQFCLFLVDLRPGSKLFGWW